MLKTGNNPELKVKFVLESKYGFVKGETYSAIRAKTKFGKTEMLCIKDSSGEEYAYPLSWFEIIEE